MLKLWRHQEEAVQAIAPQGRGMLAMDMGCVDGEATVIVSRGKATTKTTIKLLYEAFHNTWDKGTPTLVRALCDGKFKPHLMKDIICTGVKPVVEITLKTGEKLKLTADHEVLKSNGQWSAAGDLTTKDQAVCNGRDDVSKAIANGTLYKPRYSSVVSVKEAGEAEVYDLVMSEPHRNFVANNMTVHNCGKTVTALALAEQWGCRSALIVCPKSVVQVWPHEFTKHLGNAWQVVPLDSGTTKARSKSIAAARLCAKLDGARLAVALNYEVVPALLEDLLQYEWDLLIMDECHRIKAPQGKQSLAVYELSKNIKHKLGLTGTPMPHSQLDVFAQFRAIDPSVFGLNYWGFEGHFADMGTTWVPQRGVEGSMAKVIAAAKKLKQLPTPDLVYWLSGKASWQVKWAVSDAKRKSRDTIADFVMEHSGSYRKVRAINKDPAGRPVYRNSEELAERMKPITYRVEAGDVLDLPEAIDETRYCVLGSKAQAIYNQLYEEFKADYGAGEIEAKNFLSRVLRLAQVANGFGVDAETGEIVQIGSEKEEALGELLADLPQDEPVIVFGRFKEDLRSIHRQFKIANRASYELSGSMNELATWQGKSGGEGLAVQLQAGGVGIDLTRARYQVYYSLDYNLGNYLQTRARVLRPGQTRSVVYIHMLTAHTVDESIAQALADREDVTAAIVRRLKTGR